MNKQAAFSLIELMVTVAIVAIVLTIGLPAMQQYLKNAELINLSNRYSGLTAYAKSEAIKRNHQVIICTSDDTTSCDDNGKKLIVVSDIDNSSAFDNDDVMLRTAAFSSGVTIYYQEVGFDKVIFTSSGAPLQAGKIVICDDRGINHAKALMLNFGGQLRRLSNSERAGITCS